MGKITVTCPKCLAGYGVDEAFVGKSAHCNKCGKTFVISRPTETVTLVYPLAAQRARKEAATKPPARDEPAGPWNVGDLILGVYEVKRLKDEAGDEKHYAEGGMGLVYRVHHLGWDLDLAVKSPKPETFETERGKQNFERECETWIDLGLHPNIVSCYYVRHVNGIPLVFAEFVGGGTLQDWIRDRRLYQGGPEQSLRRVLDIAIQFAWGLNYAHEQGLVHQDVKPGNVMMRAGAPKVTDFGLAKARVAIGEAEAGRPQKGGVVTWGGMTPGYCSPEQIEAAVQVESGIPAAERTKLTRHTDVWSWGVSVLEMFCGAPPCRHGGQTAGKVLRAYSESPSEDPALPAMPKALAGLLQRCFRKRLSERPHDMAEIADRLREIFQGVTGRRYSRQQPVIASLKADGLNNRAASLLDLGKHEEAAALLEEAWQQYPWQPQLTHNRALLAWRAGGTTDTDLIAHLGKLVKTRPRDWEAAYALGIAQLERGDVQPAVEALQLAISLGAGEEVRGALERAQTLLSDAPRCVRSFTSRAGGVPDVYLSTDHRWALSAVDDATLRVWEAADGRLVLSFSSPQAAPGSSTLSGDGHWELAVAEEDATFQLREAASGNLVTVFCELQWGAAAAESPDGRWTLAAGENHVLELCESATGGLVRSFRGHTGAVHSISLSADGCWALSGGGDKTLRLWEVETGRCLRTFKGHAGAVSAVFLAPDASWAFSVSTDGTLRVWDIELLSSTERRFVAPVLLCHVTSSEEASLAQARFENLCSTAESLAAEGRYQDALRLAREARSLPGYGTAREALDLWNQIGSRCVKTDFRDASCVQTFEGHTGDVRCGVLGPDARFVLSASGDQTLRLWDTETGLCKRTLSGHMDSVRSVSLSSDGRWAISASWDRTLRLWDVLTGECRRVFEGHAGSVNSVLLSPDSRWALSGGWDRSVRLWRVSSGRAVRSFAEHTAYVNSVTLSADGCWVVSGSEDKTVRLWNAATGACLRVFQGHGDWVCGVAVSPDARRVLSGGKDRTLRLWDTASGRCIRQLDGHTNLVTSVSISADGRWALSGSKDNTMRLWDLASGQCRHVFQGHTGLVSSVALSADGCWALSASEDGLLHLWELDWNYEFPGWAEWDEAARCCLETFLTRHMPYGKGDVARTGRPKWSEDDFRQLLRELQHQGFGWLEPEGVRRQLEGLAAEWQGPLPPGGR